MINLPPDIEKAVQRHIASGRFSSAEDVLRAAVGRLDDSDVESLRDSLADEDAGRLKPLSDVASDIRQKFKLATPE